MKLQVGVKALIQNDQGKYLVLRRSVVMANETEPHWDIPGGRIEPEEALRDALNREILEETGMQLDSEPVLLGAQDIFVPSAELHVVRLTYQMQGAGDIVTSHEHQDAKWATIDEALFLNLDPYLRAILDQQKSTS